MRIGERFTMASKAIINAPVPDELSDAERKQLAGDFAQQLGGLISPVPVPLLPLRPDLRTQPLYERPRIMRASTADWTFSEEETLP